MIVIVMKNNITKILKLIIFIVVIGVCYLLYIRTTTGNAHVFNKGVISDAKEEQTLVFLNIKLSSNDIKSLYQSSEWVNIQMIRDEEEYDIEIKTTEDDEEAYQLRIEDEVYRLYNIDDNILNKSVFMDIVKSLGIKGTTPELINLSFNEVDMGRFILEKKLFEQIRDKDGNYFIDLQSKTELINEIKYSIDSKFEKAIDYFDKDKLAKYIAIYKMIGNEDILRLNELQLKYDHKSNKLEPYITLKSCTHIINSEVINEHEETELDKLYEYNHEFRDLVNSYIIQYMDEDIIINKVVEGYKDKKISYKNEKVSNILISHFELIRNEIDDFTKIYKSERRQKLKFDLEGKWEYLETSHTGGLYTEPIDLILETSEDCNIYYTLDGSEPTDKDTLYSQPINIHDRIGEKDILTMISNVALEWRRPRSESFKGTVVRSVVYNDGKRISEIMTNTYFVDKNIYNKYSLPIVSLVTDADNLFDRIKGIYVLGRRREYWFARNPGQKPSRGSSANYTSRGREWERPINVQWFEPDGTLGFSQNLGVRINGGWSRSYPLKSLKLYARSEYDEQKKIEHNMFTNLEKFNKEEPINEFKSFILRNSGHDFVFTMFEDAMIQSLMENTNVDTQAYRPVIVFINGEYWGINNARERQDVDYLQSHYDMEEDDIVLLENRYDPLHGEKEDTNHYHDMLSYIKNHDITEKETYDYVKTMMDMDNYIDYNILEQYIVNLDWMNNNVKYWRKKTDEYLPGAEYGHDGRWRWLLFDTEAGYTYYDSNMIKRVTATGENAVIKADWATFLFRNLIKNDEFKNKFLARYADLLNTNFKEEVVLSRINEMQENIRPEMKEHIDRWTYPRSLERWDENVDVLRKFASERPKCARRNLINYFGLRGTITGSIYIDAKECGHIEINSMSVPMYNELFEGIYFKNIPINIKAVPNKGYTFSSFEGTYESDKNNITITPSDDFEIRAKFVKE